MVYDNIETVRGRVFNLGGGQSNSISLLELIDEISQMRGAVPSLRFDEWRPGDQPWYVSRIDAIASAVGWKPEIPLRQGLPSLLQWLEERFGPAPTVSAKELRQ
jgi:CDP-paratose 2-epimerase